MTQPEELSTLAFVLTTHCNLSCSECSVNVPRIARPEHYDVDYIKRAASYFHGIDTVVLTGGEPTGHPQFAEIVPHSRTWFGCRALALATNGYRVIEHAGVLTQFDDIYVSHYEHNQEDVAFLATNFSTGGRPARPSTRARPAAPGTPSRVTSSTPRSSTCTGGSIPAASCRPAPRAWGSR